MPTVAELKARARVHNKKHCIKLSQRKAQLMSALAKSTNGSGAGSAGASGAGAGASASGAGAGNVQKKKKKRIKPVLVSPLAPAGAGASASASAGTIGQKNFKKKMSKMKKAYQKLKGKDANKDLAF
jgi:hypothetical protein